MNAKLEQANQKLTPGDLIEMFILDLTPLGVSEFYYFTNSVKPDTGDYVTFGGVDYYAVDFKSEGWEFNGQGAFPRPVLTISNAFRFLSGLLYQNKDLVGAKITRVRTYAEFLDGMPNADAGVTFDPDKYVIFQKRKHNKRVIEFVLAAQADQQGVTVPSRKVLRDTCTHSYRVWNGTAFDYTDATCPYVGTAYFNKNGGSTVNPANDACSYQLNSGCKKRFGNQNLPTRAFPGVVRVKY